MIRETYEKIVQGLDVRQNVSLLRKEIKEENGRPALAYLLSGDFSVLEKLLADEDAKTRKNTALLIGDLGDNRLLKALFEAYEKETTLFVRSAYLTAMKEFDCREYLSVFKEQIKVLEEKLVKEDEQKKEYSPDMAESKHSVTMPNKKHILEELHALSDLVVLMEGIEGHTFTGGDQLSDLVLLTNRNHVNVTAEQLKELGIDTYKEFGAGIMLTTDKPSEIARIRTVEEILFAIKGMKNCPMEPEAAAKKIVDAGFIDFLEERHGEEAPFYFRIECKSKMPLDKKSAFTRKMADYLEQFSARMLINSTSRYEVELRLIENKEGNFNVLVKLGTWKDMRFTYRKEVIATSIKPVNAALTVALAKDYIKPEGKVLDPFCGTGTMLIERHKQVPANTSYGIDIYGEAIEKAKVNTETAHQIIHYINRDFFDFKHEYLFDEIITNMPMATAKKSEKDIYDLYRRFFKKAGEHLTEDGTIIMYTHNLEMVKELAKKNEFHFEQMWEISKKEGTYVVVLKY